MKLIFFVIISLIPVLSHGQDVKSFKQVKDRIDVTLSEGTLSICPLTDNAIRIKFSKDPIVQIPELVFASKIWTPQFSVSDAPSKLELKVKDIQD
jgi:alpha-D-xyloside xylohydrolase